MNYVAKATAKTPAHIIFLIDVSESMLMPCHGRPRINVVHTALTEVILQLAAMSTVVVGGQVDVRPRFMIAILGYNVQIHNPYGGFVPIKRLTEEGIPLFRPEGETNTFLGFQEVERLLDAIWPSLGAGWPAPMVCHLTDGEYNVGNSPLPLAERIQARMSGDGPVLVENIFVTDTALRRPITNLERWPGVRTEGELQGNYAVELFRMSSPIPIPYLDTMRYFGFSSIEQGARLMFPGDNPELIKRALVTTGSSAVPGQGSNVGPSRGRG